MMRLSLLGDLGAARRGGSLFNMPVYFANPVGKGRPAGLHSRHVLEGRGFDDKAIDIFEYRGGTVPELELQFTENGQEIDRNAAGISEMKDPVRASRNKMKTLRFSESNTSTISLSSQTTIN